jgi:hypothetical protein
LKAFNRLLQQNRPRAALSICSKSIQFRSGLFVDYVRGARLAGTAK